MVPLSYVTEKDLKNFRSFSDDIHDVKRFMNDNLLSPTPPARITETISPFEIKFNTPRIGVPHIIKVSYFPNWKVSGADAIYPVSPGFMLVIPSRNEVTLTYGRVPADILGIIFTLAGFIICIAAMCGVWRRIPKLLQYSNIGGNMECSNRVTALQKTQWWHRHPCLWINAQYPKFWDFVYSVLRPCILAAIIILLIVSTTYSLINRNYPVKTYRKGMSLYSKGEYEDAIRTFQKITRDKKYDMADVILSMLFEGRSYLNMKMFDNAIKTYQDIIDTYPYSRYVAEAYYEIGQVYLRQNDTESAKAAFKKAMNVDTYSNYARYAKERLEEPAKDASTSLIYNKGVALFNEGKYEEAVAAFIKITSANAFDEPEYPLSLLIEAKCHTYLGDWDKGIQTLRKVLANYKDSTYMPEYYYEMGLIYLAKNKKEAAEEMFKKAVETDSSSPYATLARDRLTELEKEL